MSKAACCFYWDDEKYDQIGKDAIDSFRTWHSDVDIYRFDSKMESIFRKLYDEEFADLMVFSPGVFKYACALFLMEYKNYDKVICLGADTITCARLGEFLDNDEDGFITTLDYSARMCRSTHLNDHKTYFMVNADVICFNEPISIRKIILKTPSFSHGDDAMFEQGALNNVMLGKRFRTSIADHPENRVYYNVRGKGIKLIDMHKPTQEWMKKWIVVGDNLFAGDGNQIKVWHYCAGFGNKSKEEIDDIISFYRNSFNEETINFLSKINAKYVSSIC